MRWGMAWNSLYLWNSRRWSTFFNGASTRLTSLRKRSRSLSKESCEKQRQYRKIQINPSNASSSSRTLGRRARISHKILVLSHFPQVDFNVVYKAPRTIGELFPFKDRVRNNFDRSRVVYSMRCKTCHAEYIGKTERALSTKNRTRHARSTHWSCLELWRGGVQPEASDQRKASNL